MTANVYKTMPGVDVWDEARDARQWHIRVLINRSAGQHWMHIQRAFEKARAAA